MSDERTQRLVRYVAAAITNFASEQADAIRAETEPLVDIANDDDVVLWWGAKESGRPALSVIPDYEGGSVFLKVSVGPDARARLFTISPDDALTVADFIDLCAKAVLSVLHRDRVRHADPDSQEPSLADLP